MLKPEKLNQELVVHFTSGGVGADSGALRREFFVKSHCSKSTIDYSKARMPGESSRKIIVYN